MIGKSILACGLLVPVLALVSGTSPDSRAEDRPTDFVSMAASGWTTEPQPSDPSASSGATCVFTVKARNYGKSDIYVMLYDSQVRRTASLFRSWKKLKIQNHRVGYGKRMSRLYTAAGSCGLGRNWRFKLKKGSNFASLFKSTNTNASNNVTTIDLGNVALRF